MNIPYWSKILYFFQLVSLSFILQCWYFVIFWLEGICVSVLYYGYSCMEGSNVEGRKPVNSLNYEIARKKTTICVIIVIHIGLRDKSNFFITDES